MYLVRQASRPRTMQTERQAGVHHPLTPSRTAPKTRSLTATNPERLPLPLQVALRQPHQHLPPWLHLPLTSASLATTSPSTARSLLRLQRPQHQLQRRRRRRLSSSAGLRRGLLLLLPPRRKSEMLLLIGGRDRADETRASSHLSSRLLFTHGVVQRFGER